MVQQSERPVPSTAALFTKQCLPLNKALINFNLIPVELKEGKIFTWAFFINSCISSSPGFSIRQVCCLSSAIFFNNSEGFFPAITIGISNVEKTFSNNQITAF